MSKEEKLIKTIEELLPKAKEIVNTKADMIILHQDAFAGDYQDQEYLLLGMFIKYIGLFGKNIEIIGSNRETIEI